MAWARAWPGLGLGLGHLQVVGEEGEVEGTPEPDTQLVAEAELGAAQMRASPRANSR